MQENGPALHPMTSMELRPPEPGGEEAAGPVQQPGKFKDQVSIFSLCSPLGQNELLTLVEYPEDPL